MTAEVWMKWADALVLAPFVSTDSARDMRGGVFVELTPKKGETEWEALFVAIDGKRIAALTSTVTCQHPWTYGWPTSFLLPLKLLKRVKKPGSSNLPVKVELELGKIEQKEGEEQPAEPEKIVVKRVTVDAMHDVVRCSMLHPEGEFPAWRRAVPAGPYVSAKPTLNGALVADFSVAASAIDGNSVVTFYQSRAAADGEEGASRALIVRSATERFFGVLMPMDHDWGDELQLPLWLGDLDDLSGEPDEEEEAAT